MHAPLQVPFLLPPKMAKLLYQASGLFSASQPLSECHCETAGICVCNVAVNLSRRLLNMFGAEKLALSEDCWRDQLAWQAGAPYAHIITPGSSSGPRAAR